MSIPKSLFAISFFLLLAIRWLSGFEELNIYFFVSVFCYVQIPQGQQPRYFFVLHTAQTKKKTKRFTPFF